MRLSTQELGRGRRLGRAEGSDVMDNQAERALQESEASAMTNAARAWDDGD